MNFRSIKDMADAISRHLYKVPRDVDLIVGIPRSGLLAANIVALELNLPLADLDGFVDGGLLRAGSTRRNPDWITDVSQSRHALVVDDSIWSGAAISKAKERIGTAGFSGKVSYLAVYAEPRATDLVDLHFETCPMPRYFGWNYMHHTHVTNWCFDIDGVLCCDPTEAENDDGPAYEEFLRTARSLRTPTYEIGWLVTSRLEKYRKPTEDWLRANGVKYRELVMLDGVDAETRRRHGLHAKFKASIYTKTGADLFIESNPQQARQIAELSGKPVVCTETHELVGPETVSLQYVMHEVGGRKKDAAQLIRRIRGGVARRVRRLVQP